MRLSRFIHSIQALALAWGAPGIVVVAFLDSSILSLPEIARIVRAVSGVKLQPQVRVKVDGPLDRLGIDMNVQSPAGTLAGRIVADVQAPGQSVRGDVSVRHLDLAPILNDRRRKSDITADARVDVRGAALSDVDTLRGSVSLHAARGGNRQLLNQFLAAASTYQRETPAAALDQGLHASALCADWRYPWGDSAAPLAERAAKLRVAVERIPARKLYPFDARTASGTSMPTTA